MSAFCRASVFLEDNLIATHQRSNSLGDLRITLVKRYNITLSLLTQDIFTGIQKYGAR